MCVIIIAKNKKIKKNTFRKAWSSNSDGFGMAWREGSEIHYKKGLMTLKEAKQFYYSRNFPFPHILHFRIASVGEVCPELTHPFVLGWETALEGQTKTGVLFQNGTSSSSLEYIINIALLRGIKLPGGKWNDARALGIIVRELGVNVLPLIDPGKIAILTPTKLEVYGDFQEYRGNLFSNLYWKFDSYSLYPKYQYTENRLSYPTDDDGITKEENEWLKGIKDENKMVKD